MGRGEFVSLTRQSAIFLSSLSCIFTLKNSFSSNLLVTKAGGFQVKNSGGNGQKKLVGLLADVALKTYLIGGWRAIHNYMDDKNINALSRANKIMMS